MEGRKKMIKRNLALILVATIILTLLAGCQTNNGDNAADSTKGTDAPATTTSIEKANFNPTGYPIVDEEITVNAAFAVDMKYIGDPDETTYWKKLRELTNIRINWTFIEKDPTALNLYFAAGNFPDFFLGSLTTERINTYGVEGGMFVDISEMIYKYMPHMVSRFKEWPQTGKIIRQLNGEIYTIPQIRLGTTAISGQVFYRTDYLDKVGLKKPDTVDEFYEALKSIKDAGLTQGFAPLLPYKDIISSLEIFLFPAFGDAVEPGFADDGTGKVVYNFTSEQFKRYLEFLNKLYKEDLLDKEIFTIDPSVTVARERNGQVAFMTWGMTIMPEDFPDGKMHLSALSPLLSEYTSTRKVAAYPYLSTSTGGINIKSKYAEEILRMLDIAYAKEEVAPGSGLDAIAANSGIKGQAYVVNEKDNTYEFLIPANWGGGSPWLYLRLNHGWNVDYGVYDMPYFNSSPNPYAREKAMAENLGPYVVDRFPISIMKYTGEESLQLANKLTDIDSYIHQMRGKFISGIEPLSNWNIYVETVSKMGINDVLKIIQDAYDRWGE
jgi:putative aldouronate transport system substrate-binding protein